MNYSLRSNTPWDSSAIVLAACGDLDVLSIGEANGAKLEAGDILVWQRVSDGWRILELAVSWLHFRFGTGEECWGIVEVFRYADSDPWSPANDLTDFSNWPRVSEHDVIEDSGKYAKNLIPRDARTRISLQCGLSNERCLVVDSRPTSDLMHMFLLGCSFYEPWFESRKEAWDVVQDRVINYSAWMECLGAEPSQEVMKSLGTYRVL